MDRPASFKQVEVITGADDILRRSFADIIGQRENPVVLFTPALLIAHAGFDRDPVIEFDARYPVESKDSRPFYTELQREHEFFFSGLGSVPAAGTRPVNWDKRLYCIDQARAEECFAFIGGIAFSNPKTGMFASVFSYDMRIPDPTSTRNQTLVVKIFGVATNTFISMFEARGSKPPYARKLPMASAAASLGFLRQHSILTSFTGEDPLHMRD